LHNASHDKLTINPNDKIQEDDKEDLTGNRQSGGKNSSIHAVAHKNQAKVVNLELTIG